jgi:hypothetical protein
MRGNLGPSPTYTSATGTEHHMVCVCDACRTIDNESRETLPAPAPEKPGVRETAEILQSYLSSNACMLLFSKLTLYRAMGECPRVKVTAKGGRFRVSLERPNGQIEHFNRDGLE